jgi:AcrR family transcriptional regulator
MRCVSSCGTRSAAAWCGAERTPRLLHAREPDPEAAAELGKALRAGVRRATVYRHFPDERALFLTCSGTFAERHPPPDPATWVSIPDPADRLAAALDALYGWYEQVEPMLTAVLRDVDTVPIIAELQAGRAVYLAEIEDGLVPGWGARGKAARRLRAALALALDFLAWRTLYERGLSRPDAIAVMSSAVQTQSVPQGLSMTKRHVPSP